MSTLELFGTVTSPYVRRVRIVAHELGVTVDRTDTATDAGQAALRAFNPLWKVPAARFDGAELFDSALINQRLFAKFGPGLLRALDPSDVAAANVRAVIDGALDSLINAFYLGKEGAQAPYLEKQRARTHAALMWLEERAPFCPRTTGPEFGLEEIALISTLDWMAFRNAYDLAQVPRLCASVARFASRPSVAETAPR